MNPSEKFIQKLEGVQLTATTDHLDPAAYRCREEITFVSIPTGDKRIVSEVILHFVNYISAVVERLQNQALHAVPNLYIKPNTIEDISKHIESYLRKAFDGDPRYAPYLTAPVDAVIEDVKHGIFVAVSVWVNKAPAQKFYWTAFTQPWEIKPGHENVVILNAIDQDNNVAELLFGE
jgi:hypothetical protein